MITFLLFAILLLALANLGIALALLAVLAKHNPVAGPQPQLKGSHFMRTFKEDRPSEIVTAVPGTVTDSEGGAVSPQPVLGLVVASNDESIVKLSQDDPANPNAVTFTYGTAKKNADGSFAAASCTGTFTDPDNPAITEVISEDITLIPGDASAITPTGRFEFPSDQPPA